MTASRDQRTDVIWMRQERTRRAPQTPVTRERICTTAITIADSDGVKAVTMRSIAEELGCGTMSLYRYVQNKEEVLDLIVDAVLGEEGLPPKPSGDFRADLRRLARARRAVMLLHPWMAQLAAGRPALGPNAIASTEFAMGALDGLDLSMEKRVRLVNTLHAFVIGFVQTEAEEAAWRRPDGGDDNWQERALPYLTHLMESGKYPHFTRMVHEADQYPDRDEAFDWQLERVLDGLSTAVRS